jgi:hypothetical protein
VTPQADSKLLDAGLLLFLVTALSLSASAFYVIGLSLGFRYSIQSYFELKDYIEITVYWLGPILVVAVPILIFYFFHSIVIDRLEESEQKKLRFYRSAMAFFARSLCNI